jgi:hypothetical protein
MGANDRFIREAIEAEALAQEYYDEIADGQHAKESRAAERYTERWHTVYQWAFEVLEWDSPADWAESNPRLTRVRAAIVLDAENEEEAYKRALPVEVIDDWLATVKPPGRTEGGHRRVVIRLHTWVMDRENGVAYDPQWLKIGDDMTALAATARALRWAHSYAQSLADETASRELRMTQVEIMFWTSTDEESDA